jgi:hypothetical protein
VDNVGPDLALDTCRDDETEIGAGLSGMLRTGPGFIVVVTVRS